MDMPGLRGTGIALLVISGAIGVLTLASSLYMLQIVDRVLTSGSLETLVVLTVLAGAAVLVMGMLDATRSAALARLAGWLEETVGPALLAIAVLSEVLARGAAQDAATQGRAAAAPVQTALGHLDATLALDLGPAVIGRWLDATRRGGRVRLAGQDRVAIATGASKFLRAFGQILMLGVGAFYVLQGALTGGGMIAASILMGRALAPVEQALGAWRQFVQARAAWRRLKRLLREVPDDTTRTRLPAPAGRLDAARLGFVAPQTRRRVLEDVSLSLVPGELLVVSGPSGSGKSTLCKLLAGALTSQTGRVRLDGVDLAAWPAEQRAGAVGYLPQHVVFFDGTLRDKIARLGTADDAALVEAAMRAGAHDLVAAFPAAYDTRVGHDGERLSGGQLQRLGLARALLGRPALLVLDEPNAHLDVAGDATLIETLKHLKADGTTIVVVSHRNNLLLLADKVLLLDRGRARAFGPRDEVLAALRAKQPERPQPTLAEQTA